MQYLEDIGKAYIQDVFVPALERMAIDLSGLDLVIGGSVSTGFADFKSDIDIYFFFEESRRDEIMKVREFMFIPKRVEGVNLQILPYPATAMAIIASVDFPPSIPTELVYDISHYIPIVEPTEILLKAMSNARNLPSSFWETRLEKRVGSLIDLVEGFYRGVVRDDVETAWMLWAPVIQGLLQTALLGAKRLYPIAKWLIPECRRSHIPMAQELTNKIVLPDNHISCISMTETVKICLNHVCTWLKENSSLYPGIIDDLEFPDRHHQ
jgi:hypothetical protein